MFSSFKMIFSNKSRPPRGGTDCNPNYITDYLDEGMTGFPVNCGMWYVPTGNMVPTGTPVETPADWFVNPVPFGSNTIYQMYKAVSLFGMDFGPPGGPGPSTTVSVVVGNETQTWGAELHSKTRGSCPPGSIWASPLCIPLRCCTPNNAPCSEPTGEAGRCGECVLFDC